MHNELNRVGRKARYQSLEREGKSVIQLSETSFQNYRGREDSVISDVFEGQFCSQIKCSQCGHESFSFDHFMDISVSFPPASKSAALKDCLQQFIQPEQIQGYKCPKCQAKDKATKDISIFRYPKVFVIHLKRFSITGTSIHKLQTSLKIPQELDMQPYGPHSEHESRMRASSYKLYGVVHHVGKHLDEGHYTC